jgi:hypothetical protein
MICHSEEQCGEEAFRPRGRGFFAALRMADFLSGLPGLYKPFQIDYNTFRIKKAR